MTRAYYNEHDAFAAAWLRGLIGEGLLSSGDVDERDVQLVQPSNLAGFTSCHFFAGIGGWPYALALAGWPADRPVWTGSCPCQPFSSAGKGDGFDDPRHLWPSWFRLIRECRPPVVFGEQVASADGLAWFDHVSVDLEAEGYAVGAADIAAASVGAPHIRQRLFFVAHAEHAERRPLCGPVEDERDRDAGTVEAGAADRPADSDAGRRRLPRESKLLRQASLGNAELGEPSRVVGDTAGDRRERGGFPKHGDEQGTPGPLTDGPGARGPWDGALPILCGDGNVRLVPAQPGLFPLASGVPNRVGTLRGSGNAIVPLVAAEFVRAFLEAEAAVTA